MRADFDRAFAALIGHEGGYQNDPNDAGGETKFGISKRTYPHLDIKTLTLERARLIYQIDVWIPLGCEHFDHEVAFAVFDAAVNSGRSRAGKWLQAAVFTKPDGVIGPVTRAAVAARNPTAVVARLNGHRLNDMTDFATWEHHSRGWSRRVAANLIALKG